MIVRQLAVLTVLFILTGCGNGDSAESRLTQAVPDRVTVIPLGGTVSIDGKPRGDLTIRLVKVGQDAPDSKSPRVVSDSEGRFVFTTYLQGDGVPAGSYRMIVEELTRLGSSGWSGPDKLQNLFNHLEEPAATVDVLEGTPQNDLKVDLIAQGRKPKPQPKYASKQRLGKPVMGKQGAR